MPIYLFSDTVGYQVESKQKDIVDNDVTVNDYENEMK